ncbi:MAG: response regulator transcription factor, partial [Gemmatimonadaceae bacterium]
MTIRLLIADDHAVMRAGIAAMLAYDTDISIVGEANDGLEAVAKFELLKPDVVLMDLRMPKLDGIGAIREITSAHPNARILALTTYEGDADIFRALSAGAVGYLVKDILGDALTEGIRSAAAGKKVIPPSVAQTLAEFTPRIELTAR